MLFSCSVCNTLLKVARVVPGSPAVCPKCGTAIAVPVAPKGAPPEATAVRALPVARALPSAERPERRAEESVPVLRVSGPRKTESRTPRARDKQTRTLVVIGAAVGCGLLGVAAVAVTAVLWTRGPA